MLAHPLLRHLAISVSLTLAAVALTMLFWPLCQWYPAAFFLVAVLAAAWRWGLWQGISTASAALLPLLFVYRSESGEAPPMPWGEVAWRLGLFAVVSGLASYLTHLCLRALGAIERFNGTLAAANDAVIFTDASGKVRHLNATAEALTGRPLAAALDQPLELVLRCQHGDPKRPVSIPLAKVMGNAATFELPADAVLLCDSGREFCIDGRAAPYRAAQDGATGMAIMFRDVTSRRERERDCLKREEQFRTLAGCAPVSLLFLDPQGRCVYANGAWQSSSSLSASESDGEGWARAVHTEDRGRLVTEWNHALRAGREFFGECRLQPRRGEARWMRLCSAPMLSEGGRLLGHVGVFEDIDARKQAELALRDSENRFTAVMRNFPGLAFLKDAAGRYVYANDAYVQALGWEPGDWPGKTDAELLPKGEPNPYCDQEQLVREQHEDHEDVVSLSLEAGHRTFQHRQFAVPCGNDADYCFGGVTIDITAQTEAEQALREARAEFEQKWQERAGDLKRSEEALKKTRTDLEKHLSECAGRQRQADDALRATRQDLEQHRRQLDEQAASRRKGEEALKAATELMDEQAEEHAAALKTLRAQLERRNDELEPLRRQLTEHAENASRLEELDAQNRVLVEKLDRLQREGAEERDRLSQQQENLATENESLLEQLKLLHEEGDSLRREYEKLAKTRVAIPPPVPDAVSEAETHQILVHSWRLVEPMESWRTRESPVDWLAYN